MKKIIAYTAVLAALMAVSCSRMEENNLADFQSSSVITLSLNPTEMVATRSAIPDVESVVSQFDWFFYPDATGTSAPVYHGHATVGDDSFTFSGPDTPDDKGIDDKGYHIGFDIERTFTNLKGDYYVYVLANYDGIDHSASDLTLATLLAKTMETNWDEKKEDYEAINNFVMDSYSGDDEATYPQLIPLSKAVADESDETKANLAVDLQRVAAKITFTLEIAKELADQSNDGTKWRPLINSANFTTYLVNALTYATVEGNTISAENALATSHQLSYETSHVKTKKTAEAGEESTTYTFDVDPFYTYPVSFDPASNNAPYFKLALPWENVDASGNLTAKGSTLFYYKAYLREAEGENKGKALTSYDRNKHYIVTLNVDVLGGTPEDYTILDTFYYVADWQSPADGTYDGYFAPRYLDIARPAYYLYGDNSTTIAVTSSHVIKAQIISVSQKTIAGADKMTTVPASAKVTPDGRVSFTLEYPLNTEIGEGNMDLTPITWTVRISHADDSSVYEDVIIYQYPSIYGEQNTTRSTSTGWLNNHQFTTNQNQNSPVYSNDDTKSLGSFNGGTPTSMDKLVLTVSSLSSLLTGGEDGGPVDGFEGVVIGDPRVKINTLYPITRQEITWDRDDLGVAADDYIDNYLIADPAKSNVIAPRFMFPSGRIGSNRTNSQWRDGSWRSAAMRCAAYQEDGYPAGRWRLPTEAEVAFCRELQRHGYIEGLFYDTNRYWTASGRYYYNGECVTPLNYQNNLSNDAQPNYRASVRCVYDLWYWGDEKLDNNGDKITGTGNPATVWLGYMTE